MADDKRHADGCLYVILAPIVVALIAGGDGDWIIGAVGIGAVALVVLVTVSALWPIRDRRR